MCAYVQNAETFLSRDHDPIPACSALLGKAELGELHNAEMIFLKFNVRSLLFFAVMCWEGIYLSPGFAFSTCLGYQLDS